MGRWWWWWVGGGNKPPKQSSTCSVAFATCSTYFNIDCILPMLRIVVRRATVAAMLACLRAWMMPPTARYETAWVRLLCNGGAHAKAQVIMFTFRKCVYPKFQVFYFPRLAHGSVRENKYLSFSVYPPRKFCASAEFGFWEQCTHAL